MMLYTDFFKTETPAPSSSLHKGLPSLSVILEKIEPEVDTEIDWMVEEIGPATGLNSVPAVSEIGSHIVLSESFDIDVGKDRQQLIIRPSLETETVKKFSEIGIQELSEEFLGLVETTAVWVFKLGNDVSGNKFIELLLRSFQRVVISTVGGRVAYFSCCSKSIKVASLLDFFMRGSLAVLFPLLERL